MRVRMSLPLVVSALLLLLCWQAYSEDVSPQADFCEFATASDARAFGWDTEATNGKPVLEVVSDSRVGRYAILASGRDFMGEWGTLVLKRELDLSGAGKGDKIVFFIKQNVSSGVFVNIEGIYRTVPLPQQEWVRVELDMDLAEWTAASGQPKTWGRKKRIAIYARQFTSSGQYIALDGLSFRIGGRQIPANIPPSPEVQPTEPPRQPVSGGPDARGTSLAGPPPRPVSDELAMRAAAIGLPQEGDDAWLLGNEDALWAVSKQNGSIVGGWNGQRRERCVERVEGTYFLEDRQRLLVASENDDAILEGRLEGERHELTVRCANKVLKDISIQKTYRTQGGTLVREIRFFSNGAAPFFLSYRSEAVLDPSFREGGCYVGAGSFGPIESAADIQSERQAMYYTNSRGMVLSNRSRGYSIAHYRSKQDGRFLLPWWTFSRAESAKDCFYYTPTGWKIPFGISRLEPSGTVSYEEDLAVSPGDYYDFVTRGYGAREELRNEIDGLGPVPSWLGDVVAMRFEGGASGREYTDFNNVKRILELTDDGYVIVLISGMGPNWADYYVDKGLVGLHGGWIDGTELREWVSKIKALSQRVKVGIYCYMDAANDSARLYREHPEWFRTTDKDGNIVNHFPGIPSRTSMFNNPECRRAILAQYDLIFDYLGVDFVYLDDALANNLVNWQTGEVLREADCYDFFRGIREVAARHGPDKAVFFNGQGNPYGDINFIEAYNRLAAEFWRPFAGVALGVETFLINRPAVRVVPLYWTKPLDREYVNRVLALGWIPALEYTEDVESRPFVSAAFEIGNANPISARYEPDWRTRKEIEIESYAVRRLGDRSSLLSFINRKDATLRQPIRIRVDSLDVERGGPLYVWQYRIEDPTKYKGYTSEKMARTVYEQSGWRLDMIAAPECRYAGGYTEELTFETDLSPHTLTMFAIGSQPAGVYSVNGLPVNFFFSKVRGVTLDGRVDTDAVAIRVRVKADCDRCEILLFPPNGWSTREVFLDDRPLSANWVAFGDSLCPLITVRHGDHQVRVVCSDRPLPVLEAGSPEVLLADDAVRVRLPAVSDALGALVTVQQEGQLLFNRMVDAEAGYFRVPLPPRRGGKCHVNVAAVRRAGGMARVVCAPVELDLPDAPPVLALTPCEPGIVPGIKEVVEVNRKIMGLDVLRAARETTPTSVTPFQSDLKALTVDVTTDTLTVDAGTTRKIEGYLGAAFGGFEIRNLRTLRIRLRNTYFGAPHINGPGIHTHIYYPTSRLFAGFIVDYHSPAGYAKRAALGVGVIHPDCNTPFPSYGKGGPPDQLVDLGPIVSEGPETELDLDLGRYAPDGWDGQVWFSVGSDWALPGRRLNARILSANQPIAGRAAVGTDPSAIRAAFLRAKRHLVVPKAGSPPAIDGVLDDVAWKHAARIEQFFLVGGSGNPTVRTTLLATYDSEYLYVAFACEEGKRRKPIVGRGDIWRDDEVEIYLDTENQRKGYKQLIVNAGGDKMELSWPGGGWNVGAIARATIAEGSGWTVEIALPFRGLGKIPSPGDTWAANFCRYRPEGADFPLELITWAPTEKGFGGDEVAKFGTLTFE